MIQLGKISQNKRSPQEKGWKIRDVVGSKGAPRAPISKRVGESKEDRLQSNENYPRNSNNYQSLR